MSTYLPRVSGPSPWSSTDCRLVGLSVRSLMKKLWEIEKKYGPRSDCHLIDMVYGRDIQYCLEQTTPEAVLAGDLRFLSEELFSVIYWLLHRVV